MNADRVDIFHITNSNCGVICIAHYFVFDFFIALDRFFDKHLMHGRKSKCIFEHKLTFFFIISKAAACTAECKSRAKNNRITYIVGSLKTLFESVCDFRRQYRLAERLAKFLEQFSVLCSFDSFKISAQNLDIALLQNAFFSELNSKVESCLTAE